MALTWTTALPFRSQSQRWLVSGFLASLMILGQPGQTQTIVDPGLNQVTTSLTIGLPEGNQITLIDATGDRISYKIIASELDPISPDQTVLKLTVQINNQKSFPINFWSDSFRLNLGSNILSPTNLLNEVVQGRSTQEGLIEFTVPNRPLNGSLSFSINNVTDELPIVIQPLTAPQQSALLPTTTTATTVSSEVPSRVKLPQGDQVTLISAAGDPFRYEILGSELERISPNQALVKLSLRMSNGSRFPVNFWNESFRLSWGEDQLAPSNSLNEVVAGNSTQTGEVTFTIPHQPGIGSLTFRLNGVEEQLILSVE